jgi:hypothetical protein
VEVLKDIAAISTLAQLALKIEVLLLHVIATKAFTILKLVVIAKVKFYCKKLLF